MAKAEMIEMAILPSAMPSAMIRLLTNISTSRRADRAGTRLFA